MHVFISIITLGKLYKRIIYNIQIGIEYEICSEAYSIQYGFTTPSQ